MKIQFKTSIWTEIELDKANIDVKKLIGLLKADYELESSIAESMIGDEEIVYEPLYETEQMMSPRENDEATIEIRDDNHNLIWSNKKI